MCPPLLSGLRLVAGFSPYFRTGPGMVRFVMTPLVAFQRCWHGYTWKRKRRAISYPRRPCVINEGWNLVSNPRSRTRDLIPESIVLGRVLSCELGDNSGYPLRDGTENAILDVQPLSRGATKASPHSSPFSLRASWAPGRMRFTPPVLGVE